MPRAFVSSMRGRKRRQRNCVTILLLCLVGWPGSARAQAPTKEPFNLEYGEPAPFEGYLLPTELAISIGQRAERCDFLREQDAKASDRIRQAEEKYAAQSRAIESERAARREEILRDKLQDERVRSLLMHPAIIVPVTVVLTYLVLKGAAELP